MHRFIRRRLSIRPSATYSLSYSSPHHRLSTMSVPTFDQMRKRMAPIWQKEEYQEDILWAGIFGSVARNRAHEGSDVDILIVLKEHERSGEPIDLRENLAEVCGREISLMCIWQGPDWAWGHVRLEALLSSRTVYGNRGDVEHLRREAMTYLNDGLKRLDLIAEAVEKLKNQVASVQTYEVYYRPPALCRAKIDFVQNFILPAQQSARQECIQELRKVVDLLNIHPLHHPIRTMLVSWAFEQADKIRALLDQDPPDVTTGAAPIWRTIWDLLQPASKAMWSFDAGCAQGGRTYIRHMLASKRLADRFEEGGQVDDSMYDEIIR
ncbi:hypothetical protein A0H81_11302 [Grifola frondosa]|uniref:Polymerase beta nucleotidyltransferase domain-containing protein n=1 Tax=Grifola frondosa TaxID=5627 RepID=A0A1C7LW46_GRIFR|nr:hypothetical protein A0H81_11302 [Grifola frondosa]